MFADIQPPPPSIKQQSHAVYYRAYVAGHSGGHIMPALTYARHKCDEHHDERVLFFSTDSETDAKAMASAQHVTKHIQLPNIKFPGLKIWRYPQFLYQMCSSTYCAYKAIRDMKPCELISMGGFISIPVCIAAKFNGIPIRLIELNVEPGKALKFTSKIADTICICHSETQDYFPHTHCIHEHYPVRFTSKDTIVAAPVARKQLGLSPDKKTILVLGGSQGSHSINDLIIDLARTMHAPDLQIIHQTGNDPRFDWKKIYDSLGIESRVFDFNPNLQPHYAAADLIICRAGAGTLACQYWM